MIAAVLVLSVAAVAAADESPEEPAGDLELWEPLAPLFRLAGFADPQDLTEPLLPDDVAPPGQPRQEFEPPAGRKLPPGAKPGALQQVIFTATELPMLGSGGLGMTWLDTSATIGMPAPTVESPLLVTAGFGTVFVEEGTGAEDPGLPSHLYDAWLQARWMRKVGKRLGVDIAVAPGWYSDFVNDTAEAFRITGHGFGAWEWDENLRVVVGVIYLDRYDVNLLPAGGLLWTPSDAERYEILFPVRDWHGESPRAAARVTGCILPESSAATSGPSDGMEERTTSSCTTTTGFWRAGSDGRPISGSVGVSRPAG